MDNKDEKLEEVSFESNDIIPDKVINDNSNSEVSADESNTFVETKNDTDDVEVLDGKDENSEEDSSLDDDFSSMSSTKKRVLIIILSFLLVIDIAALVIYLIGIDKVLGFIK